MFLNPLTLRNFTIPTPLFCAPMAGISHSAFRRLIAGFGGYGALFTEMLSGKALLHEKIGETPFTKRRVEEGIVWYQLAISGEENLQEIIEKLITLNPCALDINAACPAPEIIPRGFGASLFRDKRRFTLALKSIRRMWPNVLTVKCRIGDDGFKWQEQFIDRLKIMEDEGVDAVIVHPRFFNEKLKRKARWELFDWIASQTRLPVIANGDIVSKKQVDEAMAHLTKISGLMVGRMAVVRPWIFKELSEGPVLVDFRETWLNYYTYVLEDFPAEKAPGRIKEFSKYFAQNFLFGHEFYRGVQSAPSLDAIKENALRFLEASPKVTEFPTVKGL
jgi:tRNA-dihydrouridine synthase B